MVRFDLWSVSALEAISLVLGVLLLPNRLEKAREKHCNGSQEQQQIGVQVQLILRVLIQNHPNCAKKAVPDTKPIDTMDNVAVSSSW